MNRIRFLDYIKGWAMIGVIFIHVVWLLPINHPVFFKLLFVDTLFRFAVPIFIGVLGYMTVAKYQKETNWCKFYLITGKKLIPLYVIWSVIYIYTPHVFQGFNYSKSIWEKLFLGYSELHLYFILPYLQFILLTPIFVWILKRKKHIATGILVGLTVLHWLLLYWSELNIQSNNLNNFYIKTDSRLFFHWLCFYTSGILIAMYQDIWKTLKEWYKITQLEKSWPFILLGYIVFVVCLWILGISLYIYSSVMLYILTAVVLVLFGQTYQSQWRITKGIEWIGRHSYGVYLSHPFWIMAMFHFVFVEAVTSFSMCIVLIGTFLLSFAYVKIEKETIKRFRFYKYQKNVK